MKMSLKNDWGPKGRGSEAIRKHPQSPNDLLYVFDTFVLQEIW